MHPPGSALLRVCTKKYKIPESDITLDIGMKVLIPTYALHFDPKYYPQPEIFDPMRFTEENKALRPDGTFLPFGDGPRICIGKYFHLTYNYKIRIMFKCHNGIISMFILYCLISN